MRSAIVLSAAFALSLVACGKQEDVQESQTSAAPPVEAPPTATPAPPPTAEAPTETPAVSVDTSLPAVDQAPAPATPAAPASSAPSESQAKGADEAKASPQPAKEAKPKAEEAKTSGGTPSREDALALANKSGCLACHAVDKKVVGPAWNEVAARYKGEGGAQAQLVEKVKKGGQGNWTQMTGGMPMPPYSPRVSDQDIDTLVRFILALR